MGRLSLYERQRARVLSEQDDFTTIKKLQQALLLEDINISRQSLGCLLRKVDATNSVIDRPKSGRRPKLGAHHLDYINRLTQQNTESSARDIQRDLLRTFQMDMSISSIKRIRHIMVPYNRGTQEHVIANLYVTLTPHSGIHSL